MALFELCAKKKKKKHKKDAEDFKTCYSQVKTKFFCESRTSAKFSGLDFWNGRSSFWWQNVGMFQIVSTQPLKIKSVFQEISG